MNKGENSEYSPEKKRINYYEENPKLVKKERKRQSLANNKNIENRENVDEQNIKLNFEDNININPNINLNIFDLNNNFSISQPMNQNNLQKENFSINNNNLDDFLKEIENEENEKNKNNFEKSQNSIENELKGLFQRSKYNVYFQTSRTQNQQFSNIWDDFHQKRDKL